MNRKSSGSLPLSKASEGFLQYKAAEGLSPNTLTNYQQDLKRWLEHQGDSDITGSVAAPNRWRPRRSASWRFN